MKKAGKAMDYLISNFKFPKAKKIGQLYYSGNCCKVEDEKLKIRKSADWRSFGQYAEQLDNVNLSSPIMSDDFYFCLDYDEKKNELCYQTDIIGYEAPFYYFSDGLFAMSDHFLELALCLKNSANVKIEIDDEKAREFILYTEPFFNDTFIKNIYHGDAALICLLNLNTFEKSIQVYDDFKMTGTTLNPKQAADKVYRLINDYFKTHYKEDTAFAIGMSGGLDSRVGAYFTKKNNYSIQSIFIGRKYNVFGIMTNDCKRAEEVNCHLGYQPIVYYDPRKIPLSHKIIFEAKNAPTVVDNIAQNMGKIKDIDCMVNGIIGGEALGALITANMLKMTAYELADYMVNRISNIPDYRSRQARRVSQLLPFGFLKDANRFKDEWVDEIVSKDVREEIVSRVEVWVKEQQSKGLDNINIFHKYFYYRFGIASKYSYYATLNNTVPSLSTYLNPLFIREMLTWKSDFLIEKKVQKELLKKLEGLSGIRSQTIGADIDNEGMDNVVKKAIRILERVLRGGAMVYTQWYSAATLKKELYLRLNASSFAGKITPGDYWYKSNHHLVFGLMKLTEIEKMLT